MAHGHHCEILALPVQWVGIYGARFCRTDVAQELSANQNARRSENLTTRKMQWSDVKNGESLSKIMSCCFFKRTKKLSSFQKARWWASQKLSFQRSNISQQRHNFIQSLLCLT
jgi:hypothetical protein